MQLSELSLADLQRWIKSASSLHKPISPPQSDIALYTDSSKEGWGGVLNNAKIGGHWTPEEASNHINYLEMLAVLVSLKVFQKELSGKHVLVKIDNMTVESDLGKMGTSHSKKRSKLTRRIWEWCLEKNMCLILSSGVAEIGASGTVTKEISQKIVLLPIAPKFGTQEVNRFSQSPA